MDLGGFCGFLSLAKTVTTAMGACKRQVNRLHHDDVMLLN